MYIKFAKTIKSLVSLKSFTIQLNIRFTDFSNKKIKHKFVSNYALSEEIYSLDVFIKEFLDIVLSEFQIKNAIKITDLEIVFSKKSESMCIEDKILFYHEISENNIIKTAFSHVKDLVTNEHLIHPIDVEEYTK